jgi:hypothetical protein
MEKQYYCEHFGTLEKLEEFTTLTNNIVPGSLVFESLSPFWGYYNEDPKDYCPLYVYLIVNQTHEVFEVTRAFQKVKQELDFELDVAKAFVKFNDRFYNALRIRHLSGYDHLAEIQEAFARHGIAPLYSHYNQKRFNALVTLKKMFCLNQTSEGIYLDACEANHAYLEIPKALTFDQFAEVTQKVRNNWLESKFDAALGYFIRKQQVVDIIRVYSENLNTDYLDGIRNLYLQKIK